MKITKNILLTLLFISTSLFSQSGGNYVYQEEFNSQGTWTKDNNEIRELYVSSGKYYFEHKKKEGSREFTTRTFNIDMTKDFEIETSILKISGEQDFGMSFLFDYKDSNNYTEFGITSTGYYRVAESISGKYSNIKSWTSSSFVKKGNYGTNKLNIKKKGNRITYYINNSYVYGMDFKKFKGSKMGFRLYRNQKVAIDYFRVKQASSTINTTNTANKTILFEGFNNNNNGWSESNSNNVRLAIENGDYILDHKRESGGWSSTISKYINSSRKFRITAQIKKVSGIQNNGYGVTFGKKDNNNQNHFLVSGDGSYKIVQYKNGTRTYIKEWTKSSVIKTGNGVYNYLKIQKDGSAYKFYINSTLVHTSYKVTLYGSSVGFTLYDKQKIHVGYLSMMYEDSTSTTNTTVTNNKHLTKETILFDGYTDNKNDWSTTKNENINLDVRNGNYYINHKRAKGGWSVTKDKYIDTSRDFKILADIKKESGILNNGYGIVFGRLDSNNQNLFFVNGNGSYSINNIKNGKDNFLKNWASSSAIRKGNGAYNVLKVVKIGSKLEYYINNTKVYTDYSPEFYGNRFGYIIYDRQEISVAYISVGYLDKKKEDTNNYNNLVDNISNYNYDNSSFYFSDQFTSNSKNWPLKNDDKAEFKVTNGKYYLNHKRKEKGWSTYRDTYIDTSRDFEIETKIDKISGVTNYAYGLIFGKKGTSDFRFYISSGGYYKIAREVDDKEQIIQKWTKTSTVNTGNSKSNTLKVKKENNYYKFYVNGSFVHQTEFEEFFGNDLGFVLFNDQEIAIDYIRVKYNGSKINTITKNTDLKLPLLDNFSSNTSKWFLEDADNYSVKLDNGKLKIKRKKKGGIFISKDVDIDTSKDFILETSISHTDMASGYYGLTFGRKNSSNEYSFLLSGNGSYKYRKFENDKYKEIIESTFSSAIKTGSNSYNVIKLVKSGDVLRFYINNQYINETPFEPFFGKKLGYTVYYERTISVDYLNIKYQTETFNNPPVVVITEPKVQRGFKIVKTKRILVRGKATDADGIFEVLVNGVEANVNADGTFTANVPLKYGENTLIVSASDLKEAKSTKEFQIIRESPKVDETIVENITTNNNKLDVGFGKYYALIIGVSEYDDPKVADLEGEPTRDAQSLADVLSNFYSFPENNITVLKNPTAAEIKKNFVLLRKKVTKNDNVLIFYAGHGNYDKQLEYGYWMPSDVEMEYELNIISNTEIVTYLRTIKSKNTLLISDACFSGSILVKSRAYEDASKAIQIKHDTESRKAITSGTLTTVPNKSIFMKFLLRLLKENKQPYLSAMELYHKIEVPIINNSPGENPPKPVYAPISQTGDMGGDFYFIKKN